MSDQQNQPAQNQMPEDVPSLQNLVRTLVAKLMAYGQTVQELIRANMELRAALHLAENNKEQLEGYIKQLLNPPAQEPAKEEPAPVETPADANTVQS